MNQLSRNFLALLLSCLFLTTAYAQPPKPVPGLQPYTPTRVEWLALLANAQLRHDLTNEDAYTLSIVNSDHETVLIFVRYFPRVNREAMNMAIDTAREVINITAKGYGWQNWVKIKERVELIKPRE